jgi:hypothetical protein
MEEPATAQMDEETTSSLRAIDVGASTTLGIFAHTNWRNIMVVHLDWLRTNGLKDGAEGAAGAVGEYSL